MIKRIKGSHLKYKTARLKRRKAFTIIELLIVIAVIAILTMIAAPRLMTYTQEAKLAHIKNDVKVMEGKMAVMLLEEGQFNTWDNNIASLNDLAHNNQLYDTSGLAREVNEELPYKTLPASFRKESNLGGVFYSNMDGKVYYSDTKGLPIDPEDPYYIPETDAPYIKSATVIPYEVWNHNMVRANIKKLNLNTINIPIRVIVDNANSNDMEIFPGDFEHANTLIDKMEYLGVDFILEPFPWIADGSIGENEWNPENIDTWFYNWKYKVLKPMIDEVATPNNVDYLTVSNNFVNMEYATGYWTGTFADVKGSFGYEGKVIYKTNWWTTATWDSTSTAEYNAKLNNSLFGDPNVDLISIASYFELTDKADPTVAELKSALRGSTKYNRGQDVYAEIRNFQWAWGKPVMFGELGVPSYDGYSVEPWNPSPTGFGNKYNKNAQYNYFKAYLETFAGHPTDDQSWFGGFSIFTIGDDNSAYRMRDNNVINYISDL